MNRTISLTLGELDKPVHIVLWQESESRESISDTLNTLLTRISSLEALVSKQTNSFFPLALAPTPEGMDVIRVPTSLTVPAPLTGPVVDASGVKNIQILPSPPTMEEVEEEMDVEEVEVEEEEVEVEEEEEEVEEEEVEEEEEEVEEDVVEAESEADAEEEDVQELEPIEWKGVTYYRDAENQVYELDSDGDINDEPIGVWSVEKKKVLRFSK